MTKVCSKCKVDKPAAEYKRRSGTDRLNPRCIPCDKEYYREYREANKAKKSTQDREYYKKNQKLIAAKAKIRRAFNAEVIQEQKRTYYAENRDEIRAKGKAHYEANKEAYIERARASKVRSAGIEYNSNVTAEALRDEYGDFCCYCSVPLDFTTGSLTDYTPYRSTVDHITPQSKAGEHSFDNCALGCAKCNSTKGVREFLWDFFPVAKEWPVLVGVRHGGISA